MKIMGRNNLEDTLVKFTVSVLTLTEEFPNSKIGLELKGQLIRSSSSVSLNYGEAQGAESRKDFIHKIKVVIKELRETNLKIVHGIKLAKSNAIIELLLQEADELISIMVASIRTANHNDEFISRKKRTTK